MSTCAQAPPRVTAFCGLGSMGYPMAAHMMSKLPGKCLVWNRSMNRAHDHAAEFGTIVASNGLADLAAADVVVMCLPTSAEDVLVAEALAPHLRRGACLVSCTSGEPLVAKRLAKTLYEQFGVHFLDGPVSGGPAGAKAGTVTCMLGADSEEAVAPCAEVLQTFTGKIVRTGPAGSACAVKSINNVLNATHLLMAAEGLLALQQLGVKPEVALAAINGSSGRSLQTQERVPREVLTRRFDYGFKLPLMAKDVRVAEGVLDAGFPQSQLLRLGAELVQEAASRYSADADYSRVVCLLEERAGTELHGSAPEIPPARESQQEVRSHAEPDFDARRQVEPQFDAGVSVDPFGGRRECSGRPRL